jgi:hypothetical protein
MTMPMNLDFYRTKLSKYETERKSSRIKTMFDSGITKNKRIEDCRDLINEFENKTENSFEFIQKLDVIIRDEIQFEGKKGNLSIGAALLQTLFEIENDAMLYSDPIV